MAASILCLAGLIGMGLWHALSAGGEGSATGWTIMSRAAEVLEIQAGTEEKHHSSAPADRDFFETAFRFPKRQIDLSGREVAAGIIPHHLLAADLIAEFFDNLRGRDYDTVILLGPNHPNAGDAEVISSVEDWQTPYGTLAVDRDFSFELSARVNIAMDEEVIAEEHSIASEVSFIKKTFPRAKFVPIILKSAVPSPEAAELAKALFEVSQGRKILVLASVDFSHYEDSVTAQAHDRESIRALENSDGGKIYGLDLDSPASISALLEFSRLAGAGFDLLNNSNSALLADKPDLESTTSYVTGYFTSPPPDLSGREVRMLFFGDLMLDRGVKGQIEGKGLDYLFSTLDERGFFSGYDLVGANLEGTVTAGGNHHDPVKENDFAFMPEFVGGLKKYNFNFFNLANNHIDDQGKRGVEETRQYLDELGFAYAGCEGGRVGDCSGRIMELAGHRVGLVGLNALWNSFDLEKAVELVSRLKSEADFTVVSIHWGEEYAPQFSASQQSLARRLIDAGADAVIGHHPHVAQGAEIYQGKIIFYSLGNFVFDQYFSEETQEELGIGLTFSKGGLALTLYPLKSRWSRLELMAAGEKDEFLKHLSEISPLADGFKDSLQKGSFFLKD